MATAAPFVKLLRQLSSAKDEYRSGALDITWEGVKATLFFVFGQPNHATYEVEGEDTLEGQEALAALLHNLPRKFTVANWRKAVVRNETLKMTVDELMEPFAQLAGATAAEAEPAAEEAGGGGIAGADIGTGFSAEFEFRLDDFPLLPLGESMWTDAAVNVVHLDLLIPKLPTSLIVLTAPNLRAAALTLAGQLIDAVWIDDHDRAAGEGAAMALMGAREGTVSCYRIDIPQLAEALTMLWRCPPRHREISTKWLDIEEFLGSLINERRDCVVRVDGATTAIGFFMGGAFIAAYTSEDRIPTPSMDGLRELLKGEGTVTVLERAGDRAASGPGEDAFHAYVAPGAANVPTYADGAAALNTEEFSAPDATDAGNAPTEDDNDSDVPVAADFEAPAAEHAVATPPETDVDPDTLDNRHAAAEPFAIDDGADIAADFFGVTAEELATPSSDPAAADAEPGDAVAAHGDSMFHIPDTAAESPAPAWQIDPEPAEEAVLDAWGTSHAADDAESAEAPAPPDFSDEPLVAADADDATADIAASPFLFGVASNGDAGGNGTEAIPAAMGSDGGYESTRLELDFDSIKQDLIQIGVLWLGSDDVAPVADLIRETKPSVDDFVATIDAIKAISVVGHDPSVIRAMAREMHYHAAEYLSGA